MIKKIGSAFTVWVVYFIFYKVFYPVTTIEAVTYQFTNSQASTSALHLQQLAWNLMIIIPLVITIFIFKYEIKKLGAMLKEFWEDFYL